MNPSSCSVWQEPQLSPGSICILTSSENLLGELGLGPVHPVCENVIHVVSFSLITWRWARKVSFINYYVPNAFLPITYFKSWIMIITISPCIHGNRHGNCNTLPSSLVRTPVELVIHVPVMQFQQVFPGSLACKHTIHKLWHICSTILGSSPGDMVTLIRPASPSRRHPCYTPVNLENICL